MDNKAYLDQIATKGQQQKSISSFISPAIIKLLLGAVILIVLIVVLTAVINSSNKGRYDSYSELYLRLSQLTAEDGPIDSNQEKLRSSKLRSNTANFMTIENSFLQKYSSMASQVGFSTVPNSKVSSAVSSDIGSYTASLDDAYMNGHLDHTFASETNYQVAILIQLETTVYNDTDNTTLKDLLSANLENLKNYQAIYKEYINNNE
ncbi:MAG: hypothetical protein Q4A96_00315 [Candidatus Saccharibacteria bacterium]|nr:hypothetical protein [Candidatus Saccharibacteria bacterium]